MASISWSDVTALAGDLGTVHATAQTAILGFVNDAGTFKADDWRGEDGTMLKLGRCWLAAHLGAVSLQDAEGPVRSEGGGGLSRSYAVSPDGLGSTSYGQSFRMLARWASGGPVLI